MHPAFHIQEILLNIFAYYPPTGSASSLLVLARTCRAFKEPALDVLWESLLDPSRLARCLPEASQSRQTSTRGGERYSFSRPLTQVESDVLRSYTRRIRSMSDVFGSTLDWESVVTFLNPATTEPLFPNLRHLYCTSATPSKKLLDMPFPSLVTLSVDFRPDDNSVVFQRAFGSLSKFSSNIRRLTVHMERHSVRFGKFFSDCICLWRNLQIVDCRLVTLNMDALAHLSRMAALTRLTFTLSPTFPDHIIPSDLPLIFSNLHELTLHSKFLEPISRLLSHTQLPAVTHLGAFIERCPSKWDVSFFLTNVQALGIEHTTQKLVLEQTLSDDYEAENPRPILRWEGLQPCTAFSNLRSITFNVEWDVDLTSNEMLTLASAWPRIQELTINRDWGWNTQGGITPDDLVQLLQKCRSLGYIALTIDTQGYTRFHRSPARLELTLPPIFTINVVDSFIEEESVPAVAAFLADFDIRSDFSFRAWDGWVMEDTECLDLWDQAYRRAIAITSRSPFLG